MKIVGNVPLAIIVPAFRTQYLEEALESITNQTNQNFNLYVFDDASDEPIGEIVEKFQARQTLTYHRFAENLGGQSLPRHWMRCVERTTEPWIWLFSDDDVMEAHCVEAFFQEFEATEDKYDLYRFNTRCIDNKSRIVSTNDPYPMEEWGRDFLMVRLLEERGSTFQELIFSRQAWKLIGGFPDYPLAWAVDDVFISKMSENKPIRSIRSARINWRLSGINITSVTTTSVFRRKIIASGLFIEWVNQFLAEGTSRKKFTSKELNAMTEAWFFRWLYFMRTRLGLTICLQVDQFASQVWGYPRGYGWIRCLVWNCRLILEAIRRKILRIQR
ncbi:MAG TPA: glycosyltransferase family A protein [Verrucomicrobiae bacterium]